MTISQLHLEHGSFARTYNYRSNNKDHVQIVHVREHEFIHRDPALCQWQFFHLKPIQMITL